MPRYFFDSEDGNVERDDVGTELPDVAAAKVEAMRYAGAIVADRPDELAATGRFRVVVRDQDGNTVARIHITDHEV